MNFTNLIRKVLSISALTLFFLPIYGQAEGVKQFGTTLNQPLSRLTQLYIHTENAGDVIRIHLCRSTDTDSVSASISDTTLSEGKYSKGTELISLSSPVANISCADPLSTTLPQTPVAAGSNVMEFAVPTAGTYVIDLKDSGSYDRWDFSVVPMATPTAAVDPTVESGNLFSYQWFFDTGSFDKADAITDNMFILVPGGFPNTNYVWALNFQDFSGNEYEITANDLGIDSPISGISAPKSRSQLTERFPVYLSYPNGAKPFPEPTNFPTLTDGFVFSDGVNDNIISPNGDNVEDTGFFNFTPDVDGTYAITIDLNLDGVYGANDRLLLGRMKANTLTQVEWDGRNAAGNIVAHGNYPVQLQLRVGEYHFVASDVETSGDGANNGLTILKASDNVTFEGTQVYWDDETLLSGSGGTSNLPNGALSSSAASGVHRHSWGDFTSDSLGNNAFIDTYVYGKASTFSANAIIASVAPVINDQSFNINEGVLLNAPVGTVVATDNDTPTLNYTITAGNTSGVIVDAFIIDPTSGAIKVNSDLIYLIKKQYLLTVEVSDGVSTASAVITVNLNSINTLPLPDNQVINLNENQASGFALTAVDAQGNAITYTLVTAPTNGIISGTIPNLIYTPFANFEGTDSLTFKASDHAGGNIGTINFNILHVNDLPIAISDTIYIVENISKTFTLKASDVNGDLLAYALKTPPNNGSLTISYPQLTFIPKSNFIGTDVLIYTVTDNIGAPQQASVIIIIEGDLDGDGIPDIKDNDDDGDGIPDDEEGNGDSDGDGIPDSRDPDSDGDGIPDEEEGTTDTDGDGTPDYLDTSKDEDGDGIPDIYEGTGDQDGDGIPNYLDIDSDNDGLLDTVEAGLTGKDSDGDGIDDFFDVDTTGGTDTNNDGIDDNITVIDTDKDGLPDYLDIDSDSDGIPDVIESQLGNQDVDGDGVDDSVDADFTMMADEDGDGIDDRFDVDYTLGIDSNKDGIDDLLLPVNDKDKDGHANHLDKDSDNDGIIDTAEADVLLKDSDNDGIDDAFDYDLTQGRDDNQDGIEDTIILTDTDGDNVPDLHDLDTDNDGIFDTVEAGLQDKDKNALADIVGILVLNPIDTDADGIADFRDLDSNNSNKHDIEDTNAKHLNSNGDGMIDIVYDNDLDGIDDLHDTLPTVHGTNAIDLDQDNDGIADITEGNGDYDNDGIPNMLDKDSDNDGLSDAFESDRPDPTGIDSDNDGIDDAYDVHATGGVDNNGDGVDDSFIEVDTDGDGMPDYLDNDSDNDGVSDLSEQSTAGMLSGNDSDADGIDDTVDVDNTGGTDSNNDGIDDSMITLTDTDNDGALNFRDSDSDGDGIADGDENGDFNNDGILDSLQVEGVVETGLKGAGSFNLLLLFGLMIIVLFKKLKILPTLFMSLFVISPVMAAQSEQFEQKSDKQEICQIEASYNKGECWYVGAGIGFSMLKPDTGNTAWSVRDENDLSYKLLLGLNLTDHVFTEFSYEDLGSSVLTNANPSTPGEIRIAYSAFSAQAGYWLNEQQSEWNAYASAGISFLNTKESQYVEQQKGSQFTLSAGVQWRFQPTWTARLGPTAYDKDAMSLGLTFTKQFGQQAKPVQVKVIKEECPNIPVVVATVAAAVPVNPDLDGDGILNEHDLCPDTLAGVKVNAKGCPLMEAITLHIKFDSWKSEVKPQYFDEIDEVSAKIKEYGEVEITIEGHTDWVGKQSQNQPLSEGRATAVAEILMAKSNLPKENFSTIGFGELQPSSDNRTAEGRQDNRRVVVLISQKQQAVSK